MCNHTHYCMPGQRSRGTRKVWSCASEHGGSIKKVSHITTCFDSYSSMGEVQRACSIRVCACTHDGTVQKAVRKILCNNT